MMFNTIPPVSVQKQINQTLRQRPITLVIHAPHTINLASNSSVGRQRSIATLVEQANFTSRLVQATNRDGYLVFHVGKSLQGDLEEARQFFISGLVSVLEKCPPNVHILLENPAGQGTEMFTDLDQFLELAKMFEKYPQFGLCLDTCHLFSAGYTIPQLLQHRLTKSKRSRLVPASASAATSVAASSSLIKLIHLNDSQTKLGSRIDRHANLGTGDVFGNRLELLPSLVQWAERHHIPMILETPLTTIETHIDEAMTVYLTMYDESHSGHFFLETNDSDPEIQLDELPRRDQTDVELDDIDIDIDMSNDLDASEDASASADADPFPNNTKIIRILSALARASDNHFRKAALGKAVETLQSLDFHITRDSQVAKCPGIGKGIRDKIAEILKTGTLEEYETHREELEAIEQLSQINGIGSVTAKNLYDKYNLKTVDMLVDAVASGRVKLTKAQASGLKYYSDIRQRIPRAEIDQFNQIFKEIIQTIDVNLRHLVVGSYRRGQPDSGDIDVLFYHPALITKTDTNRSEILEQILNKMNERHMVDTLLSSGLNKIMLIAHLPSVTTSAGAKAKAGASTSQSQTSRRVDFLLTPLESFATASLYFTGSKDFNVVSRNRAIRLGYRLNEYGLFTNQGGELTRIPVYSEADVFKLLGLHWLEPSQREREYLNSSLYRTPLALTDYLAQSKQPLDRARGAIVTKDSSSGTRDDDPQISDDDSSVDSDHDYEIEIDI